MQLMGPRSQERELPEDNCHCGDPIKKFFPSPPQLNMALSGSGGHCVTATSAP